MSVAERPPITRWITTDDVADRTGRHPQTIRRWARQGVLPPAKVIHGQLYWPDDVINEWMTSQPANAQEA